MGGTEKIDIYKECKCLVNDVVYVINEDYKRIKSLSFCKVQLIVQGIEAHLLEDNAIGELNYELYDLEKSVRDLIGNYVIAVQRG